MKKKKKEYRPRLKADELDALNNYRRLKEEAEMSRREKAEAESAQRLARTKGGKRGLLSSVRGYSEMSEEDDTLGA